MKFGIRDGMLRVPFEERFQKAGELGFDGVELCLGGDYRQHPLFSDEGVEQLLKLSEEAGVAVSSFSPGAFTGVSYLNPDDEKRREGIEKLNHLSSVAPQFGVEVILVPFFGGGAIPADRVTDQRLIDGVRETAETAAENGVALADGFIKIDEWCRTSVEGVYAIGDVAGQPMLAHVGSHEGMVAAEHIAGVAKHPMTYGNIPSVGYCHPEVASIGMSQAQAEEAGHDVVTGKYSLGAHGRALTAGAGDGFVKIVADAKYGEVLGVHMIGHNVSELVAEVGMARELETTLDEIVGHAHAHPSMAEAVMEAALAALGRAIHM